MTSHMAHPKYPNIEELFVEVTTAFTSYDGYLLASTITPAAPASHPGRLYNIVGSSNRDRVQADIRYATLYSNQVPFNKQEANAWLDVYVAYWRTCAEVVVVEEAENRGKYHLSDWSRVYEAWKEFVNALIRGYSNGSFPAWTVPCIFTAGKYLRIFAVKADEQLSKGKGGVSNFSTGMEDIGDALNKNKTLEDAARHTNRFFSLCLSDRAPIEQSRKWGIYGVANLLFKTYFKLNSISLSKNILRSISASTTDLPPLEHFPKSHVATFKYYTGVISFLEEDYATAQQRLSYALQICPRFSMRNRELILTYLVPCHLLTTRTLPTKALLAPYPRLEKLFVPLCRCIKKGDLKGFNEALETGQEEFVKRRIYLTLERGRDVAMRNLLRKVFIAAGFEDGEGSVKVRKTRINVDEFVAALRLGVGPADAEELDKDEVECLLANMIYKNLMKGYIARERGVVVLSKKGDAFPGTGV